MSKNGATPSNLSVAIQHIRPKALSLVSFSQSDGSRNQFYYVLPCNKEAASVMMTVLDRHLHMYTGLVDLELLLLQIGKCQH